MKSHSGLSRPELASTEALLVSSWERFRTRMGRLALTMGKGEGEGLVERTFILYDPSPQRSLSLLALFARGFAPVDR